LKIRFFIFVFSFLGSFSLTAIDDVRDAEFLHFSTDVGKIIEFQIINYHSGGYSVILSHNNNLKILGFSENGQVRLNSMPPAMKQLLEIYANELRNSDSSNVKSRSTVLKDGDAAAKVEPLLHKDGEYNTWAQGTPYNKFTPLKNGENAWVGCGALSTGQIMWFWQHPKRGKGSKDGIDYGNTEYRWDLMPSSLSEISSTLEIDAVATMLYHLGTAIEMRYNYPEESLTHPSNIAPALGDQEEYGEIEPGNFRYHAVYDDGFIGTAGASQTAVVLITELDAGRPVQFNALKPAGHAFVCDGYDSKGETEPLNYYFHFNFGWGGQYDGYFLLSAIGPVHETDITFIPNYKIVKEIYPVVETCDDTICSGHGKCVETAGIPECVCDKGYVSDNMYRCILNEDPDIFTDEDTVDEDIIMEPDGNVLNDDDYFIPDEDSVHDQDDNVFIDEEDDSQNDSENSDLEEDAADEDVKINTDGKSKGCSFIIL